MTNVLHTWYLAYMALLLQSACMAHASDKDVKRILVWTDQMYVSKAMQTISLQDARIQLTIQLDPHHAGSAVQVRSSKLRPSVHTVLNKTYLSQFDAVHMHLLANVHPLVARKKHQSLPLDAGHKQSLPAFIKQGGGFVGTGPVKRSFSGGGRYWPAYGEIVGSGKTNHIIPDGGKQAVVHLLKISEPRHPSTLHLPALWKHRDQIFAVNTKAPGKAGHDARQVLITRDVSGSTTERPSHQLVSWHSTLGSGRIICSGLGCSAEAWQDPFWRQHVWAMLCYAINIPIIKLVSQPASPHVPGHK